MLVFRASIEARVQAADPFGDARKVRAHVVTMLVQTQPADAAKTLSKAKQICDFIETGRALEAVS